MVKFSKQLEVQLVPEWRGAYCQYKLLKKILNKIKESPCSIPDDPEIHTSSASSLNFIQNRSKNFWSHIDLIQVICLPRITSETLKVCDLFQVNWSIFSELCLRKVSENTAGFRVFC